MDKRSIYSASLFMNSLLEVKENNVMSVKKEEMKLIYSVIEEEIEVTPAMLQSFTMETLDNALDILSSYNRSRRIKSEGVNPLDEMQRIVTTKGILASYKPRTQIVGDEDYF